MQQAWVGLVLSLKEDERGQGLLLKARVTSLWPCLSPWGCLLFSAVCLGDLPDHGTLLFLPAPVLWGLKATARGRKEGVAHQKVQRKVAGAESGKLVALA